MARSAVSIAAEYARKGFLAADAGGTLTIHSQLRDNNGDEAAAAERPLHLLALSASSPYWQGRDTGLASYRLTVFDNLPRTGLPPRFSSWAEYHRSVDVLIDLGVIDSRGRQLAYCGPYNLQGLNYYQQPWFD